MPKQEIWKSLKPAALAAQQPKLRKYLRDFESGRNNPDSIKCRFVLANGTVVDRPIKLTDAGNVAKEDLRLFDAKN